VRLQAPARRRPNVNITSLIDVLFLLLTFFLVTTTFIEQSALKVELPSMENSDKVQRDKNFVLNVSSGGEMAYNGEIVTEDVLRGMLTSTSSEVDAGGGLVLRADEELPYGDVMRILDLIKGAGIRRFVIATEKKH
jgi:biopolymer transport protein ExbD